MFFGGAREKYRKTNEENAESASTPGYSIGEAFPLELTRSPAYMMYAQHMLVRSNHALLTARRGDVLHPGVERALVASKPPQIAILRCIIAPIMSDEPFGSRVCNSASLLQCWPREFPRTDPSACAVGNLAMSCRLGGRGADTLEMAPVAFARRCMPAERKAHHDEHSKFNPTPSMYSQLGHTCAPSAMSEPLAVGERRS